MMTPWNNERRQKSKSIRKGCIKKIKKGQLKELKIDEEVMLERVKKWN